MYSKRSPVVYTVGHSNRTFDAFARLLELHQVQVVADVRSYPFSKYCKHFDTDCVRTALKKAGYIYVYMGSELGGMPKGEEYYDASGNVRYDRIASSAAFVRGLERLHRGLESFRIALMCAEENPTNCHRRLLIGRVLEASNISVSHIRGDGILHSDVELESIDCSVSTSDVEQLTIFDPAPMPQVAEPASLLSVRSITRPLV